MRPGEYAILDTQDLDVQLGLTGRPTSVPTETDL
jgi:hypothetical protein